jgi:homoserine O-acetyltransferase
MTETGTAEIEPERTSDPSADHEIFALGHFPLQSGVTLPDAKLAYKTYGELNAARDNAVLMPTFFGGQHGDTELMMAPGRALDPGKFFIIVPSVMGNGLSSSPSNTPSPLDGPSFPNITAHDNIVCQYQLVTEALGIDHLRLVVGFSMGAQQAFHWDAVHPEMVDAIAPICGSAKTSAHNYMLLEGAKAALVAAGDFDHGWYEAQPVSGLLAFCRVYSSLVLCSDFYRKEEYRKLGLASPEDVMRFFEGFFRQRDANDLLAGLWTWQHADVSANNTYSGDFAAALGAIKARAIIMPSITDFLFQVSDNEVEVELMPNAELRPIPRPGATLQALGPTPPTTK